MSAIAVAASHNPVAADPSDQPAVQAVQSMDISRFRIKDDEFWTKPRESDRLANDLVGRFEGVLVDGPRRISVGKRSTFPLGLYQMGPIRQVVSVPFERHGVVIAIDVTHNRLYAASGDSFNRDSDPVAHPVNTPTTYPDGDTCQTSSLELREALRLPWQPAKFLVTAIIRDQVSNRAPVALVGGAKSTQLRATPGHRISDPDPLLDAGKLANSPPIPEKTGIALLGPDSIELGRGGPWMVRGAFRLAPTPQEIMKSDGAAPHSPSGEQKPSAIVTIYLVVTGHDGWMNVFPVRVPSWSLASGVASGYFAVDLRRLPGAPATPQTYFIYAFSGSRMAGPLICAATKAP